MVLYVWIEDYLGLFWVSEGVFKPKNIVAFA